MSDLLTQYPDAQKYIDLTPDLKTTAQKVARNGKEYLLVSQVSDFEGGQLLLEITPTGLVPVLADNSIDLDRTETHFESARRMDACRASADGDHSAMAEMSAELVNKFWSADGPEGGALACVWAVQHIAKKALARWITRTDGTAVFYPELKACMGVSPSQNDVPAGGIIISPAEERPNGSRNIGHVGILGPITPTAGNRLIYSNSSGRKRWEQNFTVASWTRRYVDTKGLDMFLVNGATS